MCFCKTKESKVLVAKRDLKVYKIGIYADDNSFNPFFYQAFEYQVNRIIFTKVKFTDIINWGFHSYINCELVPFYNSVNIYSCRKLMFCIAIPKDTVYTVHLGKFIVPKGATYCLNKNGEIVSDKLMYTGDYIEITTDKIYDTKELWKENQVKYLLIMAKPIKQYNLLYVHIVHLGVNYVVLLNHLRVIV